MIDGKHYISKTKEYYSFLISEFNLNLIDEKIIGNAFYDIRYGDKVHVISISYENIENYFQVIIFNLQNGKMPNYEDKSQTIHLSTLNTAIISRINSNEILLNNNIFSEFLANNEIERKLLKAAKELRLCLKHV
jgi:hypothetical protein